MTLTSEPHPITTVDAVAATAHPLRRRLLDLILVYGPATSTRLAARTRQPADVVARHLGILRDAQLIEPAAGPDGEGDATRWRLPAAGNVTMTNDLPDDPASRAVLLAAHMVNWERTGQLFGDWLAARETFPEHWRISGFSTDEWLWLSPAELFELAQQICELTATWSRRTIPDDGEDRQPVFVVAQAARTEP